MQQNHRTYPVLALAASLLAVPQDTTFLPVQDTSALATCP